MGCGGSAPTEQVYEMRRSTQVRKNASTQVRKNASTQVRKNASTQVRKNASSNTIMRITRQRKREPCTAQGRHDNLDAQRRLYINAHKPCMNLTGHTIYSSTISTNTASSLGTQRKHEPAILCKQASSQPQHPVESLLPVGALIAQSLRTRKSLRQTEYVLSVTDESCAHDGNVGVFTRKYLRVPGTIYETV